MRNNNNNNNNIETNRHTAINNKKATDINNKTKKGYDADKEDETQKNTQEEYET